MWKRLITVALIVIVFLPGSSFLIEAPLVAAGDAAILDPKGIRLPETVYPKLDSRLNRLVQAGASENVIGITQTNSKIATGEQVRIIMECQPCQAGAVRQTIAYPAIVELQYEDLLQVLTPISGLTSLAETAGVIYLRYPDEPLPAGDGEGVNLINADEWQKAELTGHGVKIGIIDVGFSGYEDFQTAGELPSDIVTFWACSINGTGSSAHRTACAEIIYDVAPGASLYLANVATDVELGNAADWMIAQGVDIISHSLGWPVSGPGDGTGPICQMVDKASAAGITWVNSAGNLALRHWWGRYFDYDHDGINEFDIPLFNEGNQIYAASGQTITAVLKWNDPWDASSHDCALILLDDSLHMVDYSDNIQDGDDRPVELLSYTANYTGTYYLVFSVHGNPENLIFHLYSYNHDLEYRSYTNSLTVPADSANALAVGAVPWNNPSFMEDFSSRGFTADGRVKPDLVAPERVKTDSYGNSAFPGTSAAAACTAGAAALVQGFHPEYSSSQIQSYLKGRSIDLSYMNPPYYDKYRLLNLGIPSEITPSIVTGNVSELTKDSARLNASLNSLGAAISANVSFQWGASTGNYSWETPSQVMTSTGNVGISLTGLETGNAYFYRARATGDGTVYGDEQSFFILNLQGEGKLVFASSPEGNGDIFIMDADGSQLKQLTNNPYGDTDPHISSDGTKIVYAAETGGPNGMDIFIMNADGTNKTNLTNSPAGDWEPVWSPDGSRIAFASYRNGRSSIYVMAADGSNPVIINDGAGNNSGPVWSPDGARIAFVSNRDSGQLISPREIYLINPDGTDLVRLTHDFNNKNNLSWSPDGTKIAFDSNGIYFVLRDGSQPTRLITGAFPAWSPDGNKFAFINNQNIFVAQADGSNPIKITETSQNYYILSWGPKLGHNLFSLTSTILSSSHNPSYFGQSVSFNATVVPVPPATGIPTGSVTFIEGETILGTVSLSASGEAVFSTTSLSGGDHSIAAIYNGDAKYQGSYSPPLVQAVESAAIDIRVMLQGTSRPESGWNVPLTVKFFTSGNNTPVDVLTATPVYTFNPSATKSGNVSTAQVFGIISGTYDISVTSPHCLINVKRVVVLGAGNISLFMGTLLEGNANNDEKVNISDFGLLARTYGKQRGQEGFDENVDFDRNDKINITDFGLLASNYSKYSPVEAP